MLAHAGGTQGGFMHQLQGQARLDLGAGLTTPAAQQVPGAQAQMLGQQQPQPDQIAGDLVGQQLTDAAFQAGGIAGFTARAFLGALGVDGELTLGPALVEFFFEGRSLR